MHGNMHALDAGVLVVYDVSSFRSCKAESPTRQHLPVVKEGASAGREGASSPGYDWRWPKSISSSAILLRVQHFRGLDVVLLEFIKGDSVTRKNVHRHRKSLSVRLCADQCKQS